MKKILLAITLSLIASTGWGKVTFNLIFSDPAGIGFNAPGNEWMITEMQYAADLLGEIIEQNATVNIEVKSNAAINYGSSLGQCWHTQRDQSGKKAVFDTHRKILDEIKLDSEKIDSKIEFNTNKFYKTKRHLLRNTFIHELTHEMGFVSWKIENYKSEHYSDFDKLLHDGRGNLFLTGNKVLKVNPKFDMSSGVYACGKNIKKLNGGRCVKIYSPEIFKRGSSFAHLDPDAHPRSIMQHRQGKNDYFIWSNLELGVMLDLGYKINWEAYRKALEKLYPSYISINIHGYNPEDQDTEFRIIGSEDFQEEYIVKSTVKNNNNFHSFSMNSENHLLIMDKKTMKCIYAFHPMDKPWPKKLELEERSYRIEYYTKDSRKEYSIGIHFIDQSLFEDFKKSIVNYIWSMIL